MLHPRDLSNYRRVALKSHLMKTLEGLILAHLRPLVASSMQFAFWHGIRAGDTWSTPLLTVDHPNMHAHKRIHGKPTP